VNSLRLPLSPELLALEALTTIAVPMLAFEGRAVLNLTVAMLLLTSDDALLLSAEVLPRLLALLTLLVLRSHSEIVAVAATAERLHPEAAVAVAVTTITAATERLRLEATASTPVASAARGLSGLAAATAPMIAVASATAALVHKCRRATTMAAAIATAMGATAAAVGSRHCRDRDRQRGNAGCEEDPGHRISPLNGKTVRSSHRSNR